MQLQGRDLQINMRGDDVALLHQELIQLGYTIPDDELREQRFGMGTRASVLDFQKLSGRDSTSIVAGAVARVGLSGAAAYSRNWRCGGAVTGAVGGAASELTLNQVASGEQVSARSVGRAPLQGAAPGVVTGGLVAAASTARGAAAIARVSTAARATSVGRATIAASRAVGAGAQAVAPVYLVFARLSEQRKKSPLAEGERLR